MSAHTSLRLRQVRVRRTPGIDDGFALSELSEGVNLVHGPNGSGKSSTARAIEAVLWPGSGSDRRLGVTADYTLGMAAYRVDVDAGHVGVQCDGKDVDAPSLPAPELRHRYHLTLQDLLVREDGDFAAEILRHSAGGYDIGAAEQALGFRDRPSASTAELKAYEAARSRLKDAQAAQARLGEEARELGELERRRDDARAAQARVRVLEIAVEHARAALTLADAERVLAGFPQVLADLTGDEHASLMGIRAEQAEVEARVAELRDVIVRSGSRAATLFPLGVPDQTVLASLREDAEAVGLLEAARDEAMRRVKDAEAQLGEARRAIGSAVSDDQLARIDGESFGELASFALEVERTTARILAAEAELQRAGDGVAPNAVDVLREGSLALARWLSEAPADEAMAQRVRALVWLLTLAAVAGWMLVGWRWSWWAAPVALLAIVLGWLATAARRASNPRATREADYARSGLAQPTAWTPDGVRARLDALHGQLADAQVAQRRADWHAEATARRHDIEERRQELEQRRATLAQRLGVAPDTDTRHLSWLADRVARWQNTLAILQGARAGSDAATRQWQDALQRAGARLLTVGYSMPDSASDVRGCTAILSQRFAEHGQHIQSAQSATDEMNALERRREALATRCAAVFARAGVPEGAEDDVKSLCALHGDYVTARDARRDADHGYRSVRERLLAEGEAGAALVESTVSALEAARLEVVACAAEFEALVASVEALRTRVDAAKRGSDVEEALTQLRVAEAALRSARARDLEAMVGDLVARHVRRVTRDTQRPAVFHRARELFAAITRGRYRLEFDDADVPSFRAFDAETGRGHALHELSSATRVQLLLAVRVAFVEMQENGVRLPLLLDEALGTSDDQRAQAIIEAVITLAQDGRQIFYFTAQRDEVSRWLSALEARQAAHAQIDLLKARELREHAEQVEALLLPCDPVPAPGGRTHGDYGSVLEVAPFLVGVDRPASVPLWYVVDDTSALHHLLSFGIRSWGALQTLIESGGVALLRDHEHAYVRARAFSRALEALDEQTRIGRGRRVTRAALVASEAVSDTQMDRVLGLVEKYDGDAAAILDALDAGDVKRFQDKKVEELRKYLIEAEYLDMRPRPTEDQQRAAVLAAVADDVARGTLVPEDLEALLLRLRGLTAPARAQPGFGVSPDPLAFDAGHALPSVIVS